MPTIIQAFEGTLLADAAYVDFPNVVLSGAQLIAALSGGENPRFTPAEAAYLASRYELVDFTSA